MLLIQKSQLSVVVFPLRALLDELMGTLSHSDAASQFFTARNCDDVLKSSLLSRLRRSGQNAARVVLVTADELVYSESLAACFQECGVCSVAIDEAHASELQSWYRASFLRLRQRILSLKQESASESASGESLTPSLVLVTATLGIRAISWYTNLKTLPSPTLTFSQPGRLNQIEGTHLHRLIPRLIRVARKFSSLETKVQTLLPSLLAVCTAARKCILFVDSKRSVSRLVLYLKELNSLGAAIFAHHFELPSDLRNDAEYTLRSTDLPVVVVATLGLNLGVNFPQIALIAHLTSGLRHETTARMGKGSSTRRRACSLSHNSQR